MPFGYKDNESKEILIWKHIKSEIVKDYKYLKKIVSRLTTTTEKNFTVKLDEWYEIYKDFLEEKSVSSTTGELHYTHPRIRAAYRSLRTNLPYLFTYKNHKKRWSLFTHEKYD